MDPFFIGGLVPLPYFDTKKNRGVKMQELETEKIDKSIKGRCWAFVVYPDSCAYNYVDMIKQFDKLCVAMAISPLHRPELNKNYEFGNEEKNHFHCLMCFDGVKNEKDLRKLLDMSSSSFERKYFDWGSICDKDNLIKNRGRYPFFLKVNSLVSYFRYLLHLDNPEKQQFPDYKIAHFVSDDDLKYNTLILLNGFSPKDYLNKINYSPDLALMDIVKDNDIKNINDLLFYLHKNKNISLIEYIKRNNYWCKSTLLRNLYN